MRHPDGLPGWANLLTPDPDSVQQFYAGVFNWTFARRPAGDGGAWLVCRKGDKVVSGIHRMPPEIVERGVPPVWTASLIVSDVAAVLQRATSAGGTVVIPATASGDDGVLASVADPSGAAIGLWQPGRHPGAELLKAPGCLTWLDLHSRDVAAALPFYRDVFGWRWEHMGDAGTPVAFLDAIGGLNTAIASAQPMPGQAPAGSPSYWLPFFASDDPHDSARRAVASGGTVFVEPTRLAGVGMYAGLADPGGGRFMVMRFETPSVSTVLRVVGSRLFGSKKR
jgi:uncharacterized protein